jgi:hypothetical protein
VKNILGVDGDYVDREMLRIPNNAFMAHDLSKPLQMPRRFDLVLSLETAEHLPPTSAATFVRSLVALGDLVLFSAAVPGQARTKSLHPNEQWPDYWVELFGHVGFSLMDCLRGTLWQNPRICWWYAQNLLFFVKAEKRQAIPNLQPQNDDSRFPVSIVHPRLLMLYADFDGMSFERQWWLLKSIISSIRKRFISKTLSLLAGKSSRRGTGRF